MSQFPSDELVRKRVSALESYSILDSISEKEYDVITRLAAQICGTPISLISLLDKDRQWFKSRMGTEIPESPIEYSFCSHAICQPREVMVVPDARRDDRFSANPLVTGPPNVVFYTGVPLVNPSGVALGTLCVLDSEQHQLTDDQIQSLRDLAGQVMVLLEGRKARYDLKRANEKLRRQNDAFKRFAKLTAQLLKAPLEQITRYTDRYLNLHKNELVPGHIESLLTTKLAAYNMKTLINGLLKNIESKRPFAAKKEKFTAESLQHYLSSTYRNSPDRLLHFRFKEEEFYANKSTLLEIFSQLIANAFNFCDKEIAEVEVGGRAMDDYYEFYVSDNGPGIPAEEQEKVFEIFYVRQPFDRYGEFNTGIGLATVKRLIEEMEGEISIDSADGEGTIVSFSLPR